MSKLKIEHGVSKINLVLLKTNIEDSISQDIELMATWSDNDRKYIVNELLRFGLAQEEDFQKYKASVVVRASRPISVASPGQPPDKSAPVAASKSATSPTTHA
jgi:hypothetical protein